MMAYTLVISLDVANGLTPELPQFDRPLSKEQLKCITDKEKGILYNKLLHHNSKEYVENFNKEENL